MPPHPLPTTAALTDPIKPTYPASFITSPTIMHSMNESPLNLNKALLARDLIHLKGTMHFLADKVSLFRDTITDISLRHVLPSEAQLIYRAHTEEMLLALSSLATTMCKVELHFRGLTHGGGMDVQNVTTVVDLHAWNLRQVPAEEWAAVLGNVGFMHGVGNTEGWLERWARLLAGAWMMTREYVEGIKVEWVDWEFSREGRLRMFVRLGAEALGDQRFG